MWIVLSPDADATHVERNLRAMGLWAKPMGSQTGATQGFLTATHSAAVDPERIRAIDGVLEVLQSASKTPLLDRQKGRAVQVSNLRFGASHPPLLIAGPCSVESEAQIYECARIAAACGASVLRGGAFKPRTSPYSFRGKGRPALQWMRQAADAHGLCMVTEIMSENETTSVAQVADLLQVGSRNMLNFALLREVGAMGKPVLLKRGMSARISDWLQAGEHLLEAGASGVIFCERGIVSFDDETRNLLDLSAVALLRHVHKQPIVVDPSHAAGRRDIIPALTRAAIGAGANGLLVEAHPNPGVAASDGPQALSIDELREVGLALSDPRTLEASA